MQSSNSRFCEYFWVRIWTHKAFSFCKKRQTKCQMEVLFWVCKSRISNPPFRIGRVILSYFIWMSHFLSPDPIGRQYGMIGYENSLFRKLLESNPIGGFVVVTDWMRNLCPCWRDLNPSNCLICSGFFEWCEKCKKRSLPLLLFRSNFASLSFDTDIT